MPDHHQWNILLDTNVLIAGLASSRGASAAILDLGEAEELQIVISQHILVEADRVFSAKFPHLVDQFRLFIKSLSPLLLDDPSNRAVREAGNLIEIDDAPILAAAKHNKIDYWVTLDTKHFKTDKVKNYLPIPIVTPGEFLEIFRKFWEQAG